MPEFENPLAGKENIPQRDDLSMEEESKEKGVVPSLKDILTRSKKSLEDRKKMYGEVEAYKFELQDITRELIIVNSAMEGFADLTRQILAADPRHLPDKFISGNQGIIIEIDEVDHSLSDRIWTWEHGGACRNIKLEEGLSALVAFLQKIENDKRDREIFEVGKFKENVIWSIHPERYETKEEAERKARELGEGWRAYELNPKRQDEES